MSRRVRVYLAFDRDEYLHTILYLYLVYCVQFCTYKFSITGSSGKNHREFEHN